MKGDAKMYKRNMRFLCVALMVCFCLSISSAYAQTTEVEDDIIAIYEITIGEDGEVVTVVQRRDNLAFGTFMYEELGNNTYQFELYLYPGFYNKIGETRLYVDYGDGTIGCFRYDSIGAIGEAVYAQTDKVKQYAPGTYTIKLHSGYLKLYDFAGAFVKQFTADELQISIHPITLEV